MNKMSTHRELTKNSVYFLGQDSTFQSHGLSFGCSFLVCKMRKGGIQEFLKKPSADLRLQIGLVEPLMPLAPSGG